VFLDAEGIDERWMQRIEEARIPVAVVAVKTWRPGAAHELVLADPLATVGIGSNHCAVYDFIEHLRQTRRILVIHKELGRGAAHCLRNPIAVAIIRNTGARAAQLAYSDLFQVTGLRRIPVSAVQWIVQFLVEVPDRMRHFAANVTIHVC
jgi:hypothetical protein